MQKCILADECIHKDIVSALRINKFQVKTVKEINLSGATDEKVFAYARKNKLILLTFDRGFGNIFRFAHIKTEGVVILLLKNMQKDEAIEILLSFLKTYKKLKGKLAIIGKNKIRISESKQFA